MNKISYSQYSTWMNCGHAWKLKYVDGHRLDDTSIHTIFGTAMHEVIQEWLDVLYNKSETVAKTMYLHDIFKEKFITLFKENISVDNNGNKVFLADKKTLTEFYEQGCEILSYVQNNYRKLFPVANVQLFGIEYELSVEIKNGVNYTGFIDIITYNKTTGKYILYDLKTSRSGWGKEKTDPIKTGQLLLYKRFFSQQTGVPEKDITVEFVILKRTVYENSMYTVPRVSKFEPSNGAPSLNKSTKSLQVFVDACFDEKGQYISEQTAKPSKESCKWCSFRTRKDLCEFSVT